MKIVINLLILMLLFCMKFRELPRAKKHQDYSLAKFSELLRAGDKEAESANASYNLREAIAIAAKESVDARI